MLPPVRFNFWHKSLSLHWTLSDLNLTPLDPAWSDFIRLIWLHLTQPYLNLTSPDPVWFKFDFTWPGLIWIWLHLTRPDLDLTLLDPVWRRQGRVGRMQGGCRSKQAEARPLTGKRVNWMMARSRWCRQSVCTWSLTYCWSAPAVIESWLRCLFPRPLSSASGLICTETVPECFVMSFNAERWLMN